MIPKQLLQPELSENALTVLKKRYLKKDGEGQVVETPEELFWRVAWEVAKADRRYDPGAEVQARAEEFYGLMARLEFLPNSPTLMNAGRELGQLSACFVLPVEDSMESIFHAITYTALIHQSGGGTGFSFSRIRPANDRVASTGGIASGPISFMKVFNAATEAVKQGGTRRGANMGILRVDHPDILAFIRSKRNGAELTNFNISVGITQAFMEAVKNDAEYDLVNPRTGLATGRLRAQEVFDEIVEGAWANGEPGIVFLDRLNDDNPTPALGAIESTNPCVAGDSLIATERGLVTIEQLAAEDAAAGVEVLTDGRALESQERLSGTTGGPVSRMVTTELRPATGVWYTGERETLRVVTGAGYEIVVTPDHRILTPRGWVPAGDLQPGKDLVCIQREAGAWTDSEELPFEFSSCRQGKNGRSYTNNFPRRWSEELGFVLGWLIGDGWLRAGDRNCRVGFAFGKEDPESLEKIAQIVNSWYGREVAPVKRTGGTLRLSYHSKFLVEFFQRLGVRPVKAADKRVPETLFQAPGDAVAGFLQGLFTADGTVGYVPGKSAYARLTAKSAALLKDVQLLLLNFGIRSRIYDRSRPARAAFSYTTIDGQQRTYTSDGVGYELEISKEAALTFLDRIGFLGDKHAAKLAHLRAKGYYRVSFQERVAAVIPAGRRRVYDLAEPVTHSFIANGIVIHNCGEQPLLPYEACNLGSINLAKMIVTKEGRPQIDWERLERVVRSAVHFLDNVIDVNRYPLPQIEELARANRKIGLGVMGFADLLIQLGIPYNSEEALHIADQVMDFIHKKGWQTSAEIGRERGVFPNFEMSIYATKGLPRLRNATVTTIAPTGTLSILAGCSSGVEPLFAVVYTRRILEGQQLLEVHPLFAQVAKTRGFYSEELMEEISQHKSLADIEEIPTDARRVFVTAYDITPEWHIRMQGVFQKHTDNAVSKTVNFRTEATKDDIRQVYMLAWELGCKGVTVYRDASRDLQVLTTGKAAESKKETALAEPAAHNIGPRPRPTVTRGITERVETGCGSLFVTINEDETGLCEIFLRMGRSGGCTHAQSEATGRLVSLALRSGLDPESVYQQLKGIRCPLPKWANGDATLSCSDAIGKVLQRYIARRSNNGQESSQALHAASSNLVGLCPECPDCGSILQIAEGCLTCRACGYSKCA